MSGYEVLQGYINVEYQLRKAEALLEQRKEEIYAKMYGEYSRETGFLVRRSMSVENAAIATIELDELHEVEFKSHYNNRKLLHDALNILSSEECEAFNHLVWGVPSSMSTIELEHYGIRSNEKLCLYIEKKRLRKVIS